ncbi:Uncharacterised protein [Clostridioides difficile]|nr:Uncharacterised protein [Clostridioides difficile]
MEIINNITNTIKSIFLLFHPFLYTMLRVQTVGSLNLISCDLEKLKSLVEISIVDFEPLSRCTRQSSYSNPDSFNLFKLKDSTTFLASKATVISPQYSPFL